MKKDWIALVKEFLIKQSSGIENSIFYAEDIGGVKYEFVLELPDDIPIKTGISGSEIVDVNKTLDDTIVNVQRVFPDGEVIVDYSFNAKGKGGDVQALDNFNKILKEGKGMKGVLLEYYDTFPVETTIPTTLENDITIPNTLESIDTPTNVVGNIYDDVIEIFDTSELLTNGKLEHSDLTQKLLSKDYKFEEVENLLNDIFTKQMNDNPQGFKNISKDEFIKYADTPTNVVDETTNIYDVNEIENYANGNQRITTDQITELEALTNTYTDQAKNIVNKLPLEDTVKKKLRNKLSQMSVKWTTFSGAGELLDIYETGVLLFYGLVAAKPELEKIASNYMIDMYNTMAEPYNAKINREEYTPNWENINEQLTKAEKITPTDIIIKKTGEVIKGAAETGMVTGFGYVPTTKDKLNKTLAYPKPVEAEVVDPMYDRIKRTFSGKFV